jgi:hypothetical protein
MLIFFIHGVATRDCEYADSLTNNLKKEVFNQTNILPYCYSSFWGDTLNDFAKVWNYVHQDLQLAKAKYPDRREDDIFSYPDFRQGFLSKFIGDFLTYFNSQKGRSIRQKIAKQLYDFLKAHPNDNELHIISHSLGTVILWDILFSQRFIHDEKEPALAIRKVIEGLEPISPNRQVKLHSITTMGSPILLLNTMLGIKTEIINNFAESYTEKPLRWLNMIHASDLVAYPLTSSFGNNISPNLLLRDEFIVEDANLWESMARTIGHSGMAIASGTGEAHVKYWDHPQCLQLLTDNITAKLNVSNTNLNSIDTMIDIVSEANTKVKKLKTLFNETFDKHQ